MMLSFVATTAAPVGGAAVAAGANDAYLIWGALLFAVAMVLLVIELFVPSGGLIGIVAGIAAIGSVMAFFRYDTGWGVGSIIGYVLLIPTLLWMFFRFWINSPLGGRVVLGGFDINSQDPENAIIASETARQERVGALKSLIGAEGVTESALRPVGTVRIGGERIDAMAEAGIIEPGTPIIVTAVYDNQIKVRAV